MGYRRFFSRKYQEFRLAKADSALFWFATYTYPLLCGLAVAVLKKTHEVARLQRFNVTSLSLNITGWIFYNYVLRIYFLISIFFPLTRGGTSMVVFEKCNRGYYSDGKPPKCKYFSKPWWPPNDFEVTPITVKYLTRLKKILISWRKVELGRYIASLP